MLKYFERDGWNKWPRRPLMRMTERSSRRRIAWAVVLGWTAVLGLCWPTVQSLFSAWMTFGAFRHGLFILPATLYLLWSCRDRLDGLVPMASWTGTSVFAFWGWMWWHADRQEDVIWQQVSLVGMLVTLVWGVCGNDVFRILRAPLGLLFFALPIGMAFEGWLQDFTAGFLAIALKAVGVPVVREGYLLSIPSGQWEVAPDCAGLRYVLPGLALGYMYAAVMYRHVRRRVLFLTTCAVFLILANQVRAFCIIFFDLIGVAEGTDHRVFSYLVYGITIVFLARVGTTWVEDTTEDATHGGSPQVDSA